MNLNELPERVYSLFDPNIHHEIDEENLQTFLDNVRSSLIGRLGKQDRPSQPLRFSSLGKKDRQLWYEANGYGKEEMSGQTYLKFLYGAIIEEMVLLLVKEAGYKVTDEQREVSVDGVLGHIDAIVDGVVVDVKSASPFGFAKFKNGSFVGDDPFGYIPQLSGYADVLTPGAPAAFIAFDKVSGELCVSEVSASIIAGNKPEEKIAHQKEVLASPEPPPRCYAPVPDGASGNMKLQTGCSYCPFKKHCYPEARLFLYSGSPRYLTTVKLLPKVYEVENWK